MKYKYRKIYTRYVIWSLKNSLALFAINFTDYGETLVVGFVTDVDNEAQTYEVIDKDFEGYLLRIVEEEIL
jgi:hypothetical protein